MNVTLAELTSQIKYVVRSVDCVGGDYIYGVDSRYLDATLRQANRCEYKMVHHETCTYFLFMLAYDTYVRVAGDDDLEIAEKVYGYNFRKMRELAEEPKSD